jgi:hypothetical protein
MEMSKKVYVLLSDGHAIEIGENEPPTKKRALPLCYHLFGRDEPNADDNPLSQG